jgi:hypothetical protein
MAISLTEFRKNAYRLANQVLQTGVPLEIVYNGRTLRLVPEKPVRLTDRLVPHPNFVVCDSGELERIDWSNEWRHEW